MDQHARDGGLAASGLADHAQRLTGRKRKAAVIDGGDVAARAAEKPVPDGKVFHQARGRDDLSGGRHGLTSSAVRSPSLSRLKLTEVIMIITPGSNALTGAT